jgi:hypothetical protein
MNLTFWPPVWHRRQWWRPFETAAEYHAWRDAGKPPESTRLRDMMADKGLLPKDAA